MVQVRGYTEDDVDVLTDTFSTMIADCMRRAMQRTVDQIKPAMTAASSAGLSPDDISVFTEYWAEEVDGTIVPFVGEVYQGSAISVAVGLADGFPSEELAGIPLIADDFQLAFMASVTPEFVDVGADAWEDVRLIMMQGIKNGESVEQIAAKMMHVTDFTKKKASTVARTAMHSSAESGSIAQLRFVGYEDHEVEKEWLYTHDGRTRPTHSAGIKPVALSKKFEVGSAHLDFPGDPSGPWSEIGNCRCTALFNIGKHNKPKMRCNGLVAASSSSTQCVIPTPAVDISGIPQHIRDAIFAAFMKHKISPAYGGAKIHKVLGDVKAELMKDGVSVPADPEWQILAIVDHMKTGPGGKFSPKYAEWLQSPAGKKAVPGFKPPTHVVAPIAPTTPVAAPTSLAQVKPPTLPPVAPKPNPSDIVFTGKTLGSHGAQVWRNPVTGERWLFKPIQGQSYSSKFLVDIDIATSRIQSKALTTRPGIYEMDLGGKHGTIQSMFDSADAFPGGKFDVMKLSDEDLLAMQREQIFDWLISNHDTHSAQWIRLTDGTLVGIDKGQAFKFFPKDKLSWDYVPVHPLHPDKLTYTEMWKAFIAGKDIHLQDPTTGYLGDYLQHLMSIDDKVYADILRPYAESRVKAFGGDVDQFLAMAVARKNSLQTDFSDFWKKALAERQKKIPAAVAPKPTPVVAPAVTTPPAPPIVTAAPTTTAPATGVTGDISMFDHFFKQDILAKWVQLGAGKKVTPAWGGSKIWKLLEDLKVESDIDWAGAGIAGSPPNELQLLRILDDAGGFAGKPKTYENVLLDWLESPAGKKSGPLFPPASLTKAPQLVTPVVQPTTIGKVVTEAEVKAAFTTIGNKKGVSHIFVELNKYKEGDTVAYRQGSGYLVYRVDRSKINPNNVSLYSQHTPGGDWHYVGEYDDWLSIVQKTGGGVKEEWSFVSPPTPVIVSKIPGLAPGDVVTMQQVWDSRFLWNAGDVIAETPDYVIGYKRRLVSDGKGGIFHSNLAQGDTMWTQYGEFTFHQNVTSMLDSWGYRLSGSAVSTTKTSTVFQGKTIGDLVTADEILSNAVVVPDTIIAYTEFDGVSVFRVRYNKWGTYDIQAQSTQNMQWSTWSTVQDPSDFGFLQHKKWFAANNDGTMPDVVKVTMPGKTVPGVPTTTKYSVPTGTEIDQSLIKANYTSFKNFEIITQGVMPGNTSTRLYWVDGNYIAYEVQDAATKEWKLLYTIEPKDLPDLLKHSHGKWYASTDTVSPTSTQGLAAKANVAKKTGAAPPYTPPPAPPLKPAPPVKAAKKATTKKTAKKTASPTSAAQKQVLTGTDTHVPGKSVGDQLGEKEIWDHHAQYVDGQVIAYGKQKWYPYEEYRVFSVDGMLLLQKKSKAGTWIGTKEVKGTWGLPGVQKWTATNDHITKPNLTAAKKFVAKKNAPPPPAPVYKPPPQFTPRNIDLSPWNDAEQEEIFQYFRSIGPSSVSANEKAIWGALQNTKSAMQAKYGHKYTGLSELEILRIIDTRRAIFKGVPIDHQYEAKIFLWLRTTEGRTWVNKRIDAPIAATDIPEPMSAIGLSTDPDIDKQVYKTVTNAEARADRTASHARYGTWRTGEKEATKTYTGGSYSSWNDAIRKGVLGSYRAKILKMQAAMRPSTRPMKLWRSVGWAEFNDPSISSFDTIQRYVGRTYVNRGFNSTSTGTTSNWGGEVLLEIDAPIGTPMNHVQDYSHYSSENETTLAAHLVYQILSVTKSGHRTVVHVRVIGVGKP